MRRHRLTGGSPEPGELIASVRALARRGRIAEARSQARAARDEPRLHEAGQAAAAVIAVEQGRFDAAGQRLGRVSRDSALRLVPAEVVAVELATDRPAGASTAERILQEAVELAPETSLELARHLFARDQLDLSERALRRVDPTDAAEPVAAEARWLESWLTRARRDDKPGPVTGGRVPVAVLDYKLPDYRRTSANVGDYVQTIAALAHLARHQGLRFHGDPELVGTLEGLQARVRAERRLSTGGDVSLVPVNRDASSLDSVPEGTWMLAFGWYMHAWFRIRHDFPFHPRLRPLFLSFHVSKPALLSAEGVEYLRNNAPIGCRDWDTVRRLLELGIPAFFSGCLTTTVDLLFESGQQRPAASAPVALVDVPANRAAAQGATTLRHASLEIRHAKLPANLRRAAQTLESYRRDYRGIVTSRLHCYLPARSLGVDVRFEPKRTDDPRFDGLVGLGDDEFDAMRRAITAKLEHVLGAIVRGDDEPAVRAIWAEVCAADLDAARRRCAAA